MELLRKTLPFFLFGVVAIIAGFFYVIDVSNETMMPDQKLPKNHTVATSSDGVGVTATGTRELIN